MPIALAMIILLLHIPLPVKGMPASRYAANSVLSEGKWATVKISETGMHFISDATLRNLGFSEPGKVHVYGTGGAVVPEALSEDMADDLPLVASMHNGKGIVFFADNHFSWKPLTDQSAPYSHTIHPYCDDSYYFLSDREVSDELPALNMEETGNGEIISRFTARVVHEQELEHLGESGRHYVGEDFRSTKSQTVNLSLPDNVGNKVTLRTQFLSKITGGQANLKYSVNGRPAIGARGDTIRGVDVKYYGEFSKTQRIVDCSDNKLALGIEYNYSGVLFTARLDYIEAFYTRALRLTDNGLHFYGTYSDGDRLRIEGCDSGTVIWDITDRSNPRAVKYRLQGNEAGMQINGTGYREFVAFSPSKVTRAATIGKQIPNQNLHSLPAPDMLIISSAVYQDGARMIADMHQSTDSMNVLILSPEDIYNEFSGGKPDVGAFRKLLKMWHDRGGAPRYCLLMGKPSFDHKMVSSAIKSAKYTPLPIWQSSTGLSEEYSYSNDDYIGMLDDCTEDNFYMPRATVHVAVGRLPATDASEARTMAQKIVDYCTRPTPGAWRNKIMMIADDSDNSQHFEQSQTMYKNMTASDGGRHFLYDRLYLDSYPLVYTAVGASYPQATERMLNNYNEGVALTTYIGHASSTGWGHEHLWEWDKIQSMHNSNLTFIYAATCRFIPWDEHEMSGGLHLMLNPKGGVVGMLAASRTVYINNNGNFSASLSKALMRKDDTGRLSRLGDAYLFAKNDVSDSNKLRFIFMGDPAMRLNNVSHTVTIDTISGIPVSDGLQTAEVKGGEKMALSGTIQSGDGTIDRNFSGTLSLLLYDAESVIETYGNGETGRKEIYNDRKTRLSAVNTVVRNGEWHTVVNVPLEISNNYQPALLSAYAWSDKGVEANGSSERLYLYGYAEEEITDTIGPKIEQFYLNTTDFKEGGIVNTNPIVFARLSDPSGINVSEGGVGHRLSLRLDEGTIYNDVAQYFTPDTEGDGGMIAYPLSDIAPGSHTLTLEAWDNVNNVSRSTLTFGVSAAADPYIVKLYTDVNPATTGVNFILDLDQPNTNMKLKVEVYDLNGRVVWSTQSEQMTDRSAKISTYWNLCNTSGIRVPRGIYLYRARVETPQGTFSSKTNRLAVTAQ